MSFCVIIVYMCVCCVCIIHVHVMLQEAEGGKHSLKAPILWFKYLQHFLAKKASNVLYTNLAISVTGLNVHIFTNVFNVLLMSILDGYLLSHLLVCSEGVHAFFTCMHFFPSHFNPFTSRSTPHELSPYPNLPLLLLTPPSLPLRCPLSLPLHHSPSTQVCVCVKSAAPNTNFCDFTI